MCRANRCLSNTFTLILLYISANSASQGCKFTATFVKCFLALPARRFYFLMSRLLRHRNLVQGIFLLLGIALFVYVVNRVGLDDILASIRLIGFGIVAVLLVSAVRHLLRALAWLYCIEEGHRQISVFHLFNVRMAGDALKLLSFTGPFLGEPAKAVLVRKQLPMVHGMSSIIIENLTYTLGVVFVVISGLVLLIANYATKSSVRIMSFVLSLCMLLVIFGVALVIFRQKMIFSILARRIGRSTNIAWFQNKAVSIEAMESNIHGFYKRAGRTFFAVLLLDLCANLVNIFEVYLILYYIGVNATLFLAYVIEAMMKIVNILFFFVPGQMGVLEGSNAILFKMLGLGLAAGVSLSLVEKIRSLVWAGYGLAVWAWILHGRRRELAEKLAVSDLKPTEVYND